MRMQGFKSVECQRDGSEDHSELEKLFRRINELTTSAKYKDRGEEAKFRYLRDAVVGKEWGLRAVIRTGD